MQRRKYLDMCKTLLLTVGEEVAVLEEEICEYRRTKLKKLSPSAFSYQLYEVKLASLRTEWEELADYVTKFPEKNSEKDEIREQLETLLFERMEEIKKQNEIHLDDYPENEELQKMRILHELRIKSLYGYFQ